jgi:hypothetical protein
MQILERLRERGAPPRSERGGLLFEVDEQEVPGRVEPVLSEEGTEVVEPVPMASERRRKVRKSKFPLDFGGDEDLA